MSQVKNLRAMFENKGDDGSPPDRGRSPGPSGSTTPGASFTGSPRPLSRIRSSFVAIEKDGRMGLQRTTSDESSLPRRRMSGDTDAESISAMSDNRSVTTAGDESAKPARRMFINDPIPESPRLPNDFDGSSHEIGAVTDQPSVNPDKQIDEEQPAKGLLPADPATATPKSDKVTGAISNGKPKSSTATPKQSTTTPSAAKKVTNRPSAISTKPSVKATASTKSPAMIKTPTPATSTNASKPSARLPARTAPKKDGAAPTTRPTASTATKSTASSAMKKPAPLKSSSSGTGFVKPKVKSPTKPVSLPPSLMAQTASSGAKGNASRPSLSAQTGNAQARASSRASAASGPSKFPKAPVSKNSRPSIGPPPKKITQERPVTRESNVNEDFLARMMRPTAASAQKTAEKAQLTPPKRTAGRPSTTSSRRESSVRSSSRAKTPSVHASEPADEHKHHTPAIDEVATETAIAESVEEAAEVAHQADLASPPEELPAPGPAQDAAAFAPESVVNDESLAEPKPNNGTEAVIAEQPVTTDDPVLETVELQDSERVADKADEAGQDEDLVEAEPEIEDAVSVSTPGKAEAIEEAAIEAATVETADEVTAIAKEVDLVETKDEAEPAAHEISEEDQVAVGGANVETAEDVTSIAEKADLVQKPAEPVAISDAGSVNEDEKIEPESAVVETKQAVEGSSDDTDIDLLAEKLAETRIAAGEDKSADEVAKESR